MKGAAMKHLRPVELPKSLDELEEFKASLVREYQDMRVEAEVFRDDWNFECEYIRRQLLEKGES